MEEMESAVAVVRRIVCSLLVLLGALAAPPAAIAQEKIRLGLLPFSESLGAVIAERQGFFKAEGLDVEVTKFESGALAVPVLQSAGSTLHSATRSPQCTPSSRGSRRSCLRLALWCAARRRIRRLPSPCAKARSAR